MRRLITIGHCEHCGERFLGNQYPNAQFQRRFCSRKCKEYAYKRSPKFRAKRVVSRRRRADQKRREELAELLEVMQKEVPV